jgi:hypothetical protein
MSGRIAATLLLLFASVTAGIVSLGMAGAQDGGDDAASGSLPLFGTVGDGTGYFQGTVSGLVASEADGTILLDGVVDGLVTTDLETVRINGQELSAIAEPVVVGAVSASDDTTDEVDTEDEVDGTPAGGSDENSLAFSSLQTDAASDCDVLYIQIETFTLDDTGDEVEAAPIIYDANAVPAADTTLLCSLADVLDTTPDATTDIVDLLNQILGGVGGATDDVSVETAEATEEVAEDDTEATEEDVDGTEEATEEDAEEPTEEDAEPTEEDDAEPTEDDRPVLTPIDDDDGTPED